MAKNNLYTMGYFRKRLKDAGYPSKVLIENFPNNDPRYWMISVSPKHCMIITCFKTKDDLHFKCDDGKKYPMCFETDSMDVIIEHIKKSFGE